MSTPAPDGGTYADNGVYIAPGVLDLSGTGVGPFYYGTTQVQANGAPLNLTGTGTSTDPSHPPSEAPAGHQWYWDGNSWVLTSVPTSSNTTVINQNTAGHHYSEMYGPQGYGTYDDSVYPPVLVALRPAPNVNTNFNDTNGDGYDDQTGLPNGVANMGGKLYYHGVRVNPDGSPMTPAQIAAADGTNKAAATWTGYGPKGQGTYYLDGPNGTPGTFIGPTQNPSSGNNSSGPGSYSSPVTQNIHSGGYTNTDTNISIKDITPAAAAAELALAGAQGANQAAHDAQTVAIADADRLQRATEAKAQFELQRYGQIQQDTQNRIAMIRQFIDAVSSTDPISYAAYLAAGGDNLQNAIATQGSAVSDRSIAGAAALLQQINAQTAPPTWDQATAGMGSGLGPAPSGGLPSSGNTPPGTGTGTPPTTTTPPADTTTPPTTTTPPVVDPFAPDSDAFKKAAEWARNGGGGSLYYGPGNQPINFDLGQYAKVPLTVAQRNDIANQSAAAFNQGTWGDHRMPGVPASYGWAFGVPGAVKPTTATPATAMSRPVEAPPAGLPSADTAIPIRDVIPTEADVPVRIPAIAAARGIRVGGLPRGPMQPTIVGDSHDGHMTGHEELAMLPPGSQVIPHEQTMQMMRRVGGLRRAVQGGMVAHADAGMGGSAPPPSAGGLPYYQYQYLAPPPTTAPPVNATAGLGGSAPPPVPYIPPPVTYTPPPVSFGTGAPPAPGSTGLPGASTTTAPPTNSDIGAALGMAGYSTAGPAAGQSYSDYIASLRSGSWDPTLYLNPYDVSYFAQDPVRRDISEKMQQSALGIPQASTQFAAQKYQLRGLPRAETSVTY